MSLSRTFRYSEWVRPLWWLIAAPTSLVLSACSWLVLLTARIRLRGEGAGYTGPAIYVNWHRHLPFTILVHGRRRRWMMMSAAPYMAPIAAWCRIMGLHLIRGATGAGGREALAELGNVVDRGGGIILAVDGPAGPPFQVKPGCVDLARSSGAPIIPVAYRSHWQKTIRSRWDRMLMVFPFDGITVEFGPPIYITAGIPQAEALKLVEQALFALDPEGSQSG